MKMNEFRKSRCMPFVKKGIRVENIYNGRKGRVSGANCSANLKIIFDGDNYSRNCQPKWKMRYFDKNGNIIKEYND